MTPSNAPTCNPAAAPVTVGPETLQDGTPPVCQTPRQDFASVSQSDWPSLPGRLTSLPERPASLRERLASLYDSKESKESHCYAARASPTFQIRGGFAGMDPQVIPAGSSSRDGFHRGLPERNEWLRSNRRWDADTTQHRTLPRREQARDPGRHVGSHRCFGIVRCL